MDTIKNYLQKLFTTNNVGLLLKSLTFFMLGLGGISCIVGTDEMVNNFTFMNLLPYIEFIGVLKLLSVVLLVIPRTSLYGAALVGSIMSAAVALHLSLMGGEGVVTPILIGSMAWVGYFLRKK
jgi:hypothetical protein